MVVEGSALRGFICFMVGLQSDLPRLSWSRSRARFSEALFSDGRREFPSFHALPSNVRAVESALLFGNRLLPLVVIEGPSGWGKSHLVECAAHALNGRGSEHSVFVSSPAHMRNDSRLDGASPVLIDNVQLAFHSPRLKHDLRLVLERRVRANKPTLLAIDNSGLSSRQIRGWLPNSREWTIGQIAEPSRSDRELIVRHFARRADAVISDRLARWLGRYLDGNGRTIMGAIQRLRLMSSHWVSDRSELFGCGLLLSSGAARDGWDPRDAIQESVERFAGRTRMISSDEILSLSVFLMIDQFGLSESSVAGYHGLDQGRVYAMVDQSATRWLDGGIHELLAGWRPDFEFVMDAD